MIILRIVAGLLVALVAASWSCAKSYFEMGRLQGMEEATREIVRGLSSHYELEGRTIPERVTKAVEGIKPSLKNAGRRARERPTLIKRNFGYLETRSARHVG